MMPSVEVAAPGAQTIRRKKSRSGAYSGTASTCCRTHGSVGNRPDLLVPSVVEIHIPGLEPVLVPGGSIAVTDFWQKELLPGPFRPDCVCDAHQRNTCLRDTTCTKIHVCREVWSSATKPIASSRQKSTTALESKAPAVQSEADMARHSGPAAHTVPISMKGLLPTPANAVKRDPESHEPPLRPAPIPNSWPSPSHGHRPMDQMLRPPFGVPPPLPSSVAASPVNPAPMEPILPRPPVIIPHTTGKMAGPPSPGSAPYFTSPAAFGMSPLVKPSSPPLQGIAPAPRNLAFPDSPNSKFVPPLDVLAGWDLFPVQGTPPSNGYLPVTSGLPQAVRDPWAEGTSAGWPSTPFGMSGILSSPWQDRKPPSEPTPIPCPQWMRPQELQSISESPAGLKASTSITGSPDSSGSFGPSDSETSDDSDGNETRFATGETWHSKALATRGKFKGLRGVGQLAVEICRDPEGRGFSMGRGRRMSTSPVM